MADVCQQMCDIIFGLRVERYWYLTLRARSPLRSGVIIWGLAMTVVGILNVTLDPPWLI